MMADKLFGWRQEVISIIPPHKFSRWHQDITAGPGGIQQIPAAIDHHGIPAMIGTEFRFLPAHVCTGISCNNDGTKTCVFTKRLKQPRISFADRFLLPQYIDRY